MRLFFLSCYTKIVMLFGDFQCHMTFFLEDCISCGISCSIFLLLKKGITWMLLVYMTTSSKIKINKLKKTYKILAI